MDIVGLNISVEYNPETMEQAFTNFQLVDVRFNLGPNVYPDQRLEDLCVPCNEARTYTPAVKLT